MFLNRRTQRKKYNKKQTKTVSNFVITTLLIVIAGFVISLTHRLFFNSGLDPNYPDLGSMITKTSYEKQTGHKIQLEILNGCGVPKLAQMYKFFLRSEGIDVLDSKNASNFDYIETKILHHRGEVKRALAVAKIMQIDDDRIIEDLNETLFFDLTLIIGKDYMNLPSYQNAVLYQQSF